MQPSTLRNFVIRLVIVIIVGFMTKVWVAPLLMGLFPPAGVIVLVAWYFCLFVFLLGWNPFGFPF